MSLLSSVTEGARHVAEAINRVAHRGERLVLVQVTNLWHNSAFSLLGHGLWNCPRWWRCFVLSPQPKLNRLPTTSRQRGGHSSVPRFTICGSLSGGATFPSGSGGTEAGAAVGGRDSDSQHLAYMGAAGCWCLCRPLSMRRLGG